ncbi:MAG: hypothetical protein DWQ07_25625 [Chloroflexi bacterium]|nr:MAG: hypothetical protein DWQ07_25625 [Chloroflexota bacterium]MBL1197198.1 hydrogenase maturation protease [Chloroflexota bacterium]NOH14492.1 hydrogenase maturation protease [Chloroflexota bacterium]
MKTAALLIGLGNPILGDDGIGWRVVEAVESKLAGTFWRDVEFQRDVDVQYLSLGGLALMENMQGYHDVLVVDSITTGKYPIGTILSMPLSALPNLSAGHTTAAHDTSLQTALETGRKMELDLPENVWVVAVEVEQNFDFSEELSPKVLASIPKAAEVVLKQIETNTTEEKVYDLT